MSNYPVILPIRTSGQSEISLIIFDDLLLRQFPPKPRPTTNRHPMATPVKDLWKARRVKC